MDNEVERKEAFRKSKEKILDKHDEAFKALATDVCKNCGGTGECETELYEGLTTCWVCKPD